MSTSGEAEANGQCVPSSPRKGSSGGDSVGADGGVISSDDGSVAVCGGEAFSPVGGLPTAARHALLHRVPLKATRWTAGFMAEQWSLVRGTMLHVLWENYTKGHGNYYANFQNAANGAGEFQNSQNILYGDGDFYKWMEAASHTHP